MSIVDVLISKPFECIYYKITKKYKKLKSNIVILGVENFLKYELGDYYV